MTVAIPGGRLRPRAWRQHADKTAPNTVFTPLHVDMGEACQFHGGEEGLVIPP